jgi:acetyltransferase-like isoleucine patch superfamily enzyme
VVSRTRITLGQAAWIGGSAIAERSVRLGKDAVVGSPTQPATVAATDVELANGATVYGQISAMRGARTL